MNNKSRRIKEFEKGLTNDKTTVVQFRMTFKKKFMLANNKCLKKISFRAIYHYMNLYNTTIHNLMEN